MWGFLGGQAMFPAAFDYLAPTTLGDALDILAEKGDDAKVMAGGQSLIPLLKLRFAQPALVLDIGRLPAMAGGHGRHGHPGVGAPTPHPAAARGPEPGPSFPPLPATPHSIPRSLW